MAEGPGAADGYTSLLAISDLYGRTKLTVSLVGMAAGVGGRGCIREMGVLGGSRLGATFFHASTNVESSAASAGTSAVASARRAVGATAAREARRRAAWRSIFFFSTPLSFSTLSSPRLAALADFDGCRRGGVGAREAGDSGDFGESEEGWESCCWAGLGCAALLVLDPKRICIWAELD
jgi:hypothetical protein